MEHARACPAEPTCTGRYQYGTWDDAYYKVNSSKYTAPDTCISALQQESSSVDCRLFYARIRLSKIRRNPESLAVLYWLNLIALSTHCSIYCYKIVTLVLAGPSSPAGSKRLSVPAKPPPSSSLTSVVSSSVANYDRTQLNLQVTTERSRLSRPMPMEQWHVQLGCRPV